MQECQTVCRDMIAAKMVHLEKYAAMPNHVHLLLLIQGDGRALRAPTVSNIVQQ